MLPPAKVERPLWSSYSARVRIPTPKMESRKRLSLRRRREEAKPLLLEHDADPNLATWSNDTPLSIAVLWEHGGMSKLLLEQGADPNIPDGDGETPLLHAARGR